MEGTDRQSARCGWPVLVSKVGIPTGHPASRPRRPPSMPFSPASRVVVSDEQVFTTLGGEAVILGLRDGVYYGLDAVGARVWALLSEPRRVPELVDAIVAEFDVTA